MAKESSTVKRPLFGKELMPGALSAELLGTFMLTSAVLATNGNIIVAALTVMVLVVVLGKVSGGHFNPAVTLALLATRQISVWKAFGHVVAQLLGAMLALIVITKFVGANPDAVASGMEVFKVREFTGDWLPMLAEAVGAVVLGLGVASVVMGKKEGLDAGFAIGGALLIGLVVTTLGSASLLNPAVALGASAYTSNAWTVVAYAVGPVLGAVVGAWLYKLMLWDTTHAKK